MHVTVKALEQWHRVPMIKFTGAANRWANHSSTPHPHPSATSTIISSSSYLTSLLNSAKSASFAPPPVSNSFPSPSAAKTFSTGGKKGPAADYADEFSSPSRFWLGRLKFDESELEAVMSGGASMRA
ncbi:hypothetical protein BDY24DRAFT_440637 [Mrakia frigida]|uniref:alpha-ketoglutarate dehydrogenase subunit KGD4 n=1 Tax=Mrakia frigida TaxID=29902 RepID=UPI003FCBFC21